MQEPLSAIQNVSQYFTDARSVVMNLTCVTRCPAVSRERKKALVETDK